MYICRSAVHARTFPETHVGIVVIFRTHRGGVTRMCGSDLPLRCRADTGRRVLVHPVRVSPRQSNVSLLIIAHVL